MEAMWQLLATMERNIAATDLPLVVMSDNIGSNCIDSVAKRGNLATVQAQETATLWGGEPAPRYVAAAEAYDAAMDGYVAAAEACLDGPRGHLATDTLRFAAVWALVGLGL